MTTGESTTTPAYDANGNMTTDQNGQQYVYNAWNQLVTVKNSDGDTIATYSYNGLGWQVTQTEDSTTTALYYSSQWQVLQEQVSGSTTASYVWSPVYVDALVCRDAGGTRLYALQDANWNVTALVDTSGTVQQRYTYTPFGVATALTASWETPETPISWNYLFQGQRRDLVTDLDNARNRWYSPSLARFLTPDPTGFDAGQNNFYAVEGNGPTDMLDPSGLAGAGDHPVAANVIEKFLAFLTGDAVNVAAGFQTGQTLPNHNFGPQGGVKHPERDALVVEQMEEFIKANKINAQNKMTAQQMQRFCERMAAGQLHDGTVPPNGDKFQAIGKFNREVMAKRKAFEQANGAKALDMSIEANLDRGKSYRKNTGRFARY